jgi:hypothetical protein
MLADQEQLQEVQEMRCGALSRGGSGAPGITKTSKKTSKKTKDSMGIPFLDWDFLGNNIWVHFITTEPCDRALEIMVNKGNHPKIALFQVCEI